jgi:serine/threonine protein kinase
VTTERPLGSLYVLEEVIGGGAMGQVWRGRDRDGHRLAFKLLRSELTQDPKVVQRFVQERSILTSIQHPNVVRMRDLVVEGDTLAIVMDFVDGADLRAMLSGPRSLPAARVAELGAGIAAGLAAVHAAGVIHRDVKPENVLVDAGSSSGRPRLTDFGIAKYVQEGTSRRSTMLVGTPQYIAPELIDGKDPTPASDLYALGIMLYELVCGVTPFAGGSTMAVLRNHAERLPGRPPGVPDSLWDLISWLLGKHAAARPQSAGQVATVLDALVPELVGWPAAPALREPPEPEPSVHTQLTEMALPAAGGPPAAAAVSPPAVERAAAAPRRASAGLRGVVLIGALSAVLILAGGGFAAARLMKGPVQTVSSPTTPALQTSQPQPTPTPATTQEPIQAPPQSTPPSSPPAQPQSPAAEREALAALNQQRAMDIPTTPLDGQWVAQLSSKYDGSEDPRQTTASGSHTFHYVDILAQFRHLQGLDLGGANITLLLSTDYGTRETPFGHVWWVTFALPGLSSESEVTSWCSTYFAPLTGDALHNVCFPRQLNALS